MITLNGFPITSAKFWLPWQGPWSAELEFTLDLVPVLPVGPAIIVVGTQTLFGTIDSDASGAQGPVARVRIIGGAGAWHHELPSQHFHNDAGVLSSAVISATAAQVLERAVVTLPLPLGSDYVRTAGPASRVLADLDWHVTLAGVTNVGPRIPSPGNPLDYDILSWDPHANRAELSSTSIIEPGTIIVSPNFGSVTIRDVEATFEGATARTTAYCEAGVSLTTPTGTGSRLSDMFRSLVREHGQTASLTPYHYRVIAQGPDGRFTLQPMDPSSGAPLTVALTDWYGIPGAKSALVTPGSECAVIFLDGNPAKPVVVAYRGGDPLASGVATQLSQEPFIGALVAFVAAAEAFFNFPGISALSGGTAQPAATMAAALATAAALPTNYSQRTKVP